ncbi:YheC/YheD family protein [Ammoniphilus sp. YIM 78166]|uniref:YheC/YheD family endospore coat-associated protein n=1 Tax=Ammoniphilus sp. YIM 78166 TaxID=1644106 RepID=UPI00106FFC29|nr:YheC/YheD family protein [Ammoniphilus sp. YIM 78166]
MSITRSAILSIRPATQQWTLHSKGSEQLSSKEQSIQLGAEETTRSVSVSSSAPLPGTFSTRVLVKKNLGSLTVGPLIGILTVRRGSGFKGNQSNYIDIINTGRKLGALVYVMAVEDIDWTKKTTSAFLPNGKSGWTRVPDFPLPNVVYNRIPYREDEMKTQVQKTLQKLQAIPGLRLYNRHFFNKWSLYESLGQHERVASYIPESKKLLTAKDLTDMVTKHALIYLKPISGKAGQGIMRLENKAGQHILKEREGSRLLTKSFSNTTSLWNELKSIVPIGYVVQEGITLLTYKGRPFDIRVLVQKDGSGTWKPTGVGIRVAGKNGITTHVPRGGSIAAPEVVLGKLMSSTAYSTFMKRLQTTVLELAHALEDNFPSLGEFSMDLGLTRDGKLWFFEANAKPMKFDEPHIRQTSLERIIQYGQYLSQFPAAKGGLLNGS